MNAQEGFKGHHETEPAETIRALRGFNIITILQASVMFILFIGSTDGFLRPTTPPDPWWISLGLGPRFELWDVLFPLVAVTIAYATWKLKWMTIAHTFSATIWGLLGSLWIIGSYASDMSDYLFGAGLFAIFIAAQHISLVAVWRAEGVE